MNHRLGRTLLLSLPVALVLLGLTTPGVRTRPAAAATTAAPTLTAPAEGSTVASFGPTLSWSNPPGTTQYHLQVIPFNNDGPGVDLHVGSPGTSFTIPPPPQWYGLLPDITYTWRIRASDAATFVGLDDASWGPFATGHFRTPKVDSGTLSVVAPALGSTGDFLNPVLTWANSRPDVFYYEVQVSRDPTFCAAPGCPMLYWELRHGGVTEPANSYAVPAAFPLEAGKVYAWRVRPRVQGDGTALSWSTTFSFITSPTAQPGSPPAGPPTGPRIVYVSNRDGANQIFSVKPDGTGLVRLTSAGPSKEPGLSSDGSKIVFTTGRDGNDEIYAMNSDGSNQTRLTRNTALDCCAEWSPDSTRVVFVSARDGNQEIYVMNADGTGQTRATNNTESDYTPHWLPDGKRITWGGIRSGNLEILSLDVEQGAETNLTKSSDLEYDPRPSSAGVVAFSSATTGDVWVINADGTGKLNVTNAAGTDGAAVWSPDGARIAFVASRDGNDEVYVMNANGSLQRNLSSNAAADCCPAWSADGTQIAFVSSRDGNKEIYVVNPDGTGRRRVTNSDGDDTAPVWMK